jgi:hypothetical protein
MEFHYHTLPNLFEQLGLPAEPNAVQHFIDVHSPLPQSMTLAEAPFWSKAQAVFLCEKILEDGDWAEVVDDLNARLHS